MFALSKTVEAEVLSKLSRVVEACESLRSVRSPKVSVLEPLKSKNKI